MPPSEAATEVMGEEDAARLGAAFVQARGYEEAQLSEVVRQSRSVWRVRFSLAPSGSGRLLQLDYDARTRELVKAEELDGVTATPVPPPAPPP